MIFRQGKICNQQNHFPIIHTNLLLSLNQNTSCSKQMCQLFRACYTSTACPRPPVRLPLSPFLPFSPVYSKLKNTWSDRSPKVQ